VPFSSFPGCDWLLNGKQRTAPCGTALLKNSITYSCALLADKYIIYYIISRSQQKLARERELPPRAAEYEIYFVFPNQPQFFLIVFQHPNTHLMFLGELSHNNDAECWKESDFIDSLSLCCSFFFYCETKVLLVLLLSPFERNFFNAKEPHRFAAFPLASYACHIYLPRDCVFFAINIYMNVDNVCAEWLKTVTHIAGKPMARTNSNPSTLIRAHVLCSRCVH